MTTSAKSSSGQEKDLLQFALEATLTSKVRDWLNKQPEVYWYKASDRYTKGVSDIIVCASGTMVAIELKAKDGAATPHQLLFIKQVIAAGGVGGVCYTLAEVKALIGEAQRRRRIW